MSLKMLCVFLSVLVSLTGCLILLEAEPRQVLIAQPAGSTLPTNRSTSQAAVSTPSSAISAPVAEASAAEPLPLEPAAEEQALYAQLNAYRAERGLPAIPYSAKLALTARVHAQDLAAHRPHQRFASDGQPCNLHSWSDQGRWTPVCYTSDHRESAKMWSKPAEIAGYSGNGYEISAYSSGCQRAGCFLEIWKKSPGHNEVMINAGIWTEPWQAVGVGIADGFAHIWLGVSLTDFYPKKVSWLANS